jgi:uncharacterized DUF497 family protein
LPAITVAAFNFDDDNEDKLAQHGISLLDVDAILNGPCRVFRNRRERRATHLISGYDRHGRCLLVCIEPTHDPVVWRPVTAWYPVGQHQLAQCP